MHELSHVVVNADPAAWANAGFSVDPGTSTGSATCTIGQTTIVFSGTDDPSDAAILAIAIAGLGPGDLDGMTLTAPQASVAEASSVGHPNGVLAIDHLVVRSPDLDRTTAALVDAGLVVRRERRFPVGSGTMRQTFFWLGDSILELVGDDQAHGDGPAVSWGIACTAIDLDAAACVAGDCASRPKRAVQPGRRICSLGGLGIPVALLTPHPKVRHATPGDLGRIVEVEVDAGARFAELGLAEIAADPIDADVIGRAVADGRVWVVERRGLIEGWVMAAVVDGEAHLAQVSVLPDAAGLGLGRMLADRVRRWATERGHAAISLTTFIDVAFNGPLYERWGYRVCDDGELGPELAAIRADEADRWPHLAGRRRAMRLEL